MRAMVLEQFGAPLKLKDMPKPKIGPNDALVRVRVCGAGLTVVIMIATPGRIKSYPRIPVPAGTGSDQRNALIRESKN